ncbi:RNA polymerase sigma-70 factor [Plesiocystis pacifica SIR-1]|uniref:RNA polymerase sigma-70 factor n=1 Tax=Plesiocystis pacifica SIR-1 TaxID=391625 RepID=A6GH26_9BACT|nr:sigma-70 family RNA polymerase sigma factor [Plesiocystis pacifica]EDM74804.1 RNA polymerase sigma-70 factor [Plesiocystis pacifica SIR-1]
MSLPAHVLAPERPRSSRQQAAAIARGCDELTLARVRSAGAGDRRAQRWLAEAVLGDVRVVARSLSSSAADADDACQYALMQILMAAANFRGESSVRHWARRVATRAVCKHRRGVWRRRAREQSFEDGMEAWLEGEASEYSEAPRHGLSGTLRAHLEALPESQSEALILRHALGYSIAEIAELTQVSPNTVKGRLRLGTRALRRLVRRESFVGDVRGASKEEPR